MRPSPDQAPALARRAYRLVLRFPTGEAIIYGPAFDTYAEADNFGFDLLCRWYAPEDYDISVVDRQGLASDVGS